MSAERCPSRIAHESGAVLGCRDVPDHVGEHWTPVAHWTDGDPRELLESVEHRAAREPTDAEAAAVLALMRERLAVQRAKAGDQRKLPSND